jgi:hypothetical protein
MGTSLVEIDFHFDIPTPFDAKHPDYPVPPDRREVELALGLTTIVAINISGPHIIPGKGRKAQKDQFS